MLHAPNNLVSKHAFVAHGRRRFHDGGESREEFRAKNSQKHSPRTRRPRVCWLLPRRARPKTTNGCTHAHRTFAAAAPLSCVLFTKPKGRGKPVGNKSFYTKTSRHPEKRLSVVVWSAWWCRASVGRSKSPLTDAPAGSQTGKFEPRRSTAAAARDASRPPGKKTKKGMLSRRTPRCWRCSFFVFSSFGDVVTLLPRVVVGMTRQLVVLFLGGRRLVGRKVRGG